MKIFDLIAGSWRCAAATLAGATATVVMGGSLFAWSGLCSVAASEAHLAIVDWFLRFGMQSSVCTHARHIEVPKLDDEDLIVLGGAHYYGQCMPFHGAPGHRPNAMFQHALPDPPGLGAIASNAAAAMLVTRAKRLDIAMIGFRIDGDTGALKRMLDEYGVPYVMCASATRADHVDYDRVFGLPLPSAA